MLNITLCLSMVLVLWTHLRLGVRNLKSLQTQFNNIFLGKFITNQSLIRCSLNKINYIFFYLTDCKYK